MLCSLLGKNHLDDEVINGKIEVANWYNRLDLPLRTGNSGKGGLVNSGT